MLVMMPSATATTQYLPASHVGGRTSCPWCPAPEGQSGIAHDRDSQKLSRHG
ncbi:hypothetical protein SCE1572_38755 [Sorangium cellulosum So0157-2]|uniref:Uncharacterized protein n=1 Tax=Sorangium cellulosum So0157-2 TaxID=1254432 RepID=S4Y528_SORCE|nr:hypothetical protein SCE1572_38755 [Sorangium cellulosum So0157-2]